MAQAMGVTKQQVAQIWAAAGLKPHRLRTFKISRDPRFAEKVVDVVGLYMNPPDNALVLYVDEKTQIQASIARNRCCLSVPGRSNVELTTISETGPSAFTLRWTLLRDG